MLILSFSDSLILGLLVKIWLKERPIPKSDKASVRSPHCNGNVQNESFCPAAERPSLSRNRTPSQHSSAPPPLGGDVSHSRCPSPLPRSQRPRAAVCSSPWQGVEVHLKPARSLILDYLQERVPLFKLIYQRRAYWQNWNVDFHLMYYVKRIHIIVLG